ncbi:MAG: PD40 domain-containing protein, partial [Chloroflexi bacterium]|nr:PD40 domain-containing protein [Chloroflexota bacterium]
AVHVANLDGSTARQIWAARQGGPIYLAWQPQGRLLALLVLGEDTLHLLASDPLTSRPWYPLAKGQPIYVSWSPDGRSAALHVGGDQQSNPEAQIALATWAASQAGPRLERLALTPSGFRAPAWSADGRWLALGIHQPDGPAVVLRARDGATYPVTSSGAEPAFVWSPVGPLIAVSDAAAGLPNVYEGIRVHDVARGTSWPVTDEQVVGFFWSPDGTRLAYMALDIASQAIAWHVVEADGRRDRRLARFLPTREQFQTFAFFDQYAQSNAVWSPDGQALVAAGWDVADGRPLPAAAPGIYVIPADGRAPPRRIGPGSQAFWSPLATPAWQP